MVMKYINLPWKTQLYLTQFFIICNISKQNQKIKRAHQVVVTTHGQSNGNTAVTLRFNDDYGITLWRMDIAVPDEKHVQKLRKRFEKDAEKIYSEIISILFREDKTEESQENE